MLLCRVFSLSNRGEEGFALVCCTKREREREMTDEGRKRATPNILVTGTPGTGKTSTCSLLASATGLRHINVGELVKEKSLHDGWDAELDCYVVNDDLVCLQNHLCSLLCA